MDGRNGRPDGHFNPKTSIMTTMPEGANGNSTAVLHPPHCGALDLTTPVIFILQEGVYSKGEKLETLALMQVLRPTTVSKNVLDAYV
jgi:hypothetical protein